VIHHAGAAVSLGVEPIGGERGARPGAAPDGIQLAKEGNEMRDDSLLDEEFAIVELEPREAASPDAFRFGGSGGSGGGSGSFGFGGSGGGSGT
jgi:hypothetical protein